MGLVFGLVAPTGSSILFCFARRIPFAVYVSFHEDTIARITIQAWILKKLSFLQLHPRGSIHSALANPLTVSSNSNQPEPLRSKTNIFAVFNLSHQ
jgi:hypothetical protein